MDLTLEEQGIAPALLSLNAAAEYLGLCRDSIYRLAGLGKLKAVKAGGKTLVTTESLQAYVASLPPAKIKPKPSDRIDAETPKSAG